MTIGNRLRASLLAAVLTLPAAAWAAKEEALDLVQPIADYKLYVAEKTDKLVADTTQFVAAIKAGDIAKAKALYAPTRMNYEAVEPVAELFNDIDGAVDSRADDHEKKSRTLASLASTGSNTDCGRRTRPTASRRSPTSCSPT